MKKIAIAFVLGLVALALFATGGALAQTAQPPVPDNGAGLGFGNGSGPLHEYMVKAMAPALGISADEFESRRAAGAKAYRIALSEGIAADKIPALLSQAHASAIAAAAADGLITQVQADWMKSRGAGMGSGNCTGAGPQFGNGMMGRGGRWQQNTP